ncbi:MAG: S1/P1 nuclease [Longimicrobiales bacterium]
MFLRARLVLLSICALGAAPVTLASFWGEEGHRIACEIAVRRISPGAQVLVAELLKPEALTLPDICTWADTVRGSTHPQTSAYHYINLPRTTEAVDMARDCAHPEQRCVIWAIQHYAGILADSARPAQDRREALKFVAHFVGDLHQPLHVSFADDRGGNQTRVEFFGDAGRPGRPRDLHSVWDTRILTRAGVQAQPWATRLNEQIPADEAKRWETLDVVAWANEAFALTTRFVYGQLPADGRISDEYYTPALRHSESQLQKAGVRLAFLLNRIAANTLVFP